MSLLVEEVFVTEGVPAFTFVRPPNYNRILVDVRTPGKPVILEGQSGTGKTTCIRQILTDLGESFGTVYFTARDPVDVSNIESIARDRPSGRYVIDDFHRLSAALQESLIDISKLSAESSDVTNITKLIIVGINQLGSSLIQLVPDIAKRIGIHRIQPGGLSEISELISTGCVKLNINILQSEQIYEESRGDYWLTQQLCQEICIKAGILSTREHIVDIDFDINTIRRDVVEQLYSAHYPAVKEFCRGKRFRPSNQPYFKVLKAIGQNGSSNVDLNELANSDPDIRGSINNIKERRLPILMDSKPMVARSFYYNKETKNFSIDDPALFYFIQHLDWERLRKDCGFRDDSSEYEFEIALSFAGENRELASHIAVQLEALDVPVFYDEMFETNFLGRAWHSIFTEIFTNRSRYVVCILDEHHQRKIWPTFERENFAPRVADETVIPIFLDDTKFVGIPSDIVGIKFSFNPSDEGWRKKADEEIVLKLVDKIT
ncbi:hypothetical protein EV667_2555 [Ancylobacter aquaticus]|uniref:AAA+ ATPase domain-containing protein n=2 Tax=Ancylobacter aquaticus TaxID=100 RepID=A0A4R1I1C8_ANCAQ|nr:hypothetical protein EV667_2555 [Ancylobacter aquaticus]